MIDVVSLVGVTRAAGTLVSKVESLTHAKGKDATRVIEFCEHVRLIIEDVITNISRDRSYFLGGKAEELRQWADIGVASLGKSLNKKSKGDLERSLICLADQLDKKMPQSVDGEHVAILLKELQRAAGRLKGIVGVLNLRQENRPGNVVIESGKWTAGVLSTIGSTVATAALTVGVAKVPFVGPTLAAWIQGNPGASDDTLEI